MLTWFIRPLLGPHASEKVMRAQAKSGRKSKATVEVDGDEDDTHVDGAKLSFGKAATAVRCCGSPPAPLAGVHSQLHALPA